MSVRSGQGITIEFVTSNPTTQAAANADSLPTGKLVVNGVDNVASVTVSNVDTGRYKAVFILPTLAVVDVAELVISATVATIAGKAVVWRDTVAALVSAVLWDEVLTTATHNVPSSAGRLLRLIIPNSDAIYSGTAPSQAGMTTTQIKLDAPASAIDSTYNFDVISITGGTDIGDSRLITAYVGATRIATVDRAWTVQPDATSTFDITPTPRVQSTLDLTLPLNAARALDAVADTALTLNDAFHCAVAAAVGRESVTGTAYVIKTPSTGTVLRSFVLDAAINPASRN